MRSRYYEREADAINMLKLGDKECLKKLCSILGVDFLKYSVAVTPEVEKRLEIIKAFTSDRSVLENFQKVALNQEELADLLNRKETTIYLCHNCFSVPLSQKGVHYIGVDNPTIENPFTLGQYKKAGIIIENINLPEKVSDEMAEYAHEVAIKNGYDDYNETHSPLATHFHDRLKRAIPFYNIHLPYNSSATGKRFKSKFTAQKELTDLLRKPYDKAESYITPGNSCCVQKLFQSNMPNALKISLNRLQSS